jgi:hypothetical protein
VKENLIYVYNKFGFAPLFRETAINKYQRLQFIPSPAAAGRGRGVRFSLKALVEVT